MQTIVQRIHEPYKAVSKDARAGDVPKRKPLTNYASDLAKQIAVIYTVSVSFAVIVCCYSLHYTNCHLEVGISLHLLLKAKGRDKSLFSCGTNVFVVVAVVAISLLFFTLE